MTRFAPDKTAMGEIVDAGEVLIIGAGLAGLFTALKLAPRPVTVLTLSPLGAGASSVWAQGGIAAALGADDDPACHAADTLAAGAGIVDRDAARCLTEDASARIADLSALGVGFDRDAEGRYSLGREAAHSRNRIVRVAGDQAGTAIMEAVVKAVRACPSIRVVADWRAYELVRIDGRIAGVLARARNTAPRAAPTLFRSRAVVLATGGLGALYAMTTNPLGARGDGVAMAARAGALIADAEFVQFHPTAIAIGRDPAPLATEALRGEGAVLINRRGERFMAECHADGELAPRDIVARAIHQQLRRGEEVFLDCRRAVGARFSAMFPTVFDILKTAGIDPALQPIPVAPAAHFHMGGIATDLWGQSSLDGLWACGEVASTGAHGANRLASNSLLETVVLGARIARALDARLPAPASGTPEPVTSTAGAMRDGARIQGERTALRQLFSQTLGLDRSAETLRHALRALMHVDRDPLAPNGSAAIVGVLIGAAALKREESRGSHFRTDFPQTDDRFAHRTFMTLDDADANARTALGPGMAKPEADHAAKAPVVSGADAQTACS